MKILFLAVIGLVLGSQVHAVPKLNFGKHVGGQLENGGKIWVVLIAGSNTFDNYRHQADICHAYQISHANGIPDEQIVVLMYDDIANNPENPKKGIIINRPGGPDVYHGVPKDYTGENVLPTTLIGVLKGDKAAVKGKGSGKVVESGPNDHIFVYFADHGGEGLICFPNFENNLYADVLNDALNDLHKNNRYAKLVFYLESCESGSMFENILAKNINIYATTAAGPAESSYGTYCGVDPDIYTCLGDEYSVAWMEDSDNNTIATELLKTQFENVKKTVAQSTPHEYGDLTIGTKFYAGDFQGNNGVVKQSNGAASVDQGKRVNSRDIPLEGLKNRIKMAKTNEDVHSLKIQLRVMEQKRDLVRKTTKNIALALAKTETEAEKFLTIHTRATNNMECYKNSVEYYIHKCFPNSPYTLGQMYVLANLCNSGFEHEDLKYAMDNSCIAVISNVN